MVLMIDVTVNGERRMINADRVVSIYENRAGETILELENLTFHTVGETMQELTNRITSEKWKLAHVLAEEFAFFFRDRG